MAIANHDKLRPPPTGAVRVTIPAGAATDLDAVMKLTRDVFERLGCPRCYSGFDIRFRHEREFIFNPQTGGIEGRIGR